MIVAVTGRRKLSNQDWVVTEIERVIQKLEPSKMISGMALGVDTIWAELAVANNIPLEAHCPFPQQSNSWTEGQQRHWEELLSKAETVTYAGEHFSKNLYFVRNKTMVEAADQVVAVWDREESGGTWHAVQHAVKTKKPVIHINFLTKSTTIQTY